MQSARWILNAAADPASAPAEAHFDLPVAFHRSMPDFSPTPVHDLPDLACELGIGELWVKDEASRCGLPSFKILGGSWAVHRLLMRLAGRDHRAADFGALAEVAQDLAPLTLCTATDGNHGRGVARMARLLDLEAVVFVPEGTRAARIDAISGEGATVRVHPGDYDGAVAAAAEAAEENGWRVVADVAYEGYVEVPRWVMDGYTTIFAECDEQTGELPTVMFLQAGIGALAGAALRHYAARDAGVRAAIVEPVTAACLLASVEAGDPVTLDDSQRSIMAGLNCGTPSLVAWPYVRALADVLLAIDDERAHEAMRLLAATRIVAGESGAAGLAGLLEACRHDAVRRHLGLDGRARVLLLNTEGATDANSYAEVVGLRPEALASQCGGKPHPRALPPGSRPGRTRSARPSAAWCRGG